MRDDELQRVLEPISGSCDRPTSAWTGDEVVDFASVAPLVERMQAAFFSCAADGRSTAVTLDLTPRQAAAGGLVPVQVPLRQPCPHCMGHGDAGDDRCTACGGVGHTIVVGSVPVRVPRGVVDGARFRLTLRAPDEGDGVVDLRVRIR